MDPRVPGDRRRRRHPLRPCHRGADPARERPRRAAVSALGQRTRVRGAPRSCGGSHDVRIDTALIDPGKPWQNATDESFNGKFRDEYLTLQWFRNRVDARVGIEQWRRHYNEVRPHSSLGYLTPAEFKATAACRSDEGGRSPAEPARAAKEEHEQRLNRADRRCSPVISGPKKAGRSERPSVESAPLRRITRHPSSKCHSLWKR